MIAPSIHQSQPHTITKTKIQAQQIHAKCAGCITTITHTVSTFSTHHLTSTSLWHAQQTKFTATRTQDQHHLPTKISWSQKMNKTTLGQRNKAHTQKLSSAMANYCKIWTDNDTPSSNSANGGRTAHKNTCTQKTSPDKPPHSILQHLHPTIPVAENWNSMTQLSLQPHGSGLNTQKVYRRACGYCNFPTAKRLHS